MKTDAELSANKSRYQTSLYEAKETKADAPRRRLLSARPRACRSASYSHGDIMSIACLPIFLNSVDLKFRPIQRVGVYPQDQVEEDHPATRNREM